MTNNKSFNLLEKIELFLNKFLLPFAIKLNEQKHFASIKDGMLIVTPFLIIGSLFMIIGYLPIPGYTDFMSRIFGKNWLSGIMVPVSATYNLMAVITNICIAYRLSERYKVFPIHGAVISLSAFMVITPNFIRLYDGNRVFNVISGEWLGGKGLFSAIIMAIFSVEIYRLCIQKKIFIKLSAAVQPAIARSFEIIIPGFIVIMSAWIISIIMAATPFENMHLIVQKLLVGPMTSISGTWLGVVAIVLVANLLWICGIHGASIMYISVAAPMLVTMMSENARAYQLGYPIPYIVTKEFTNIFANIGGSGCTLGLVILMCFFAKSAHLKEIGKMSLGLGIFNINEPVIFGTPIIMNPILLIPFILAPVVSVSAAYLLTYLNIIPRLPGIALPWTTPAGVSGFIASGGHISTGILQIFLIFISVIIYYPFFKMLDETKKKEEEESPKY